MIHLDDFKPERGGERKPADLFPGKLKRVVVSAGNETWKSSWKTGMKATSNPPTQNVAKFSQPQIMRLHATLRKS